MSRMSQEATPSEDRKGEEHEGAGASAGSPCVTGHIYKVVHTTGLDGKNLLELLPLSKHIGNIVSLVQPPVISEAKGKDSRSGHGNFKDLLTNITSSSFVKAPELKTVAPGKLILPKALKEMENMKVAPLAKENPTTPSASSIHSSHHSANNSLGKNATLVSSDKSSAEYVPVNKRNLPVSAKSPIVPSGHHLQIPAHAEVKSVPASFLPPTVQQKILATAASNASRTCEITNTSTVIYVSPVNTVKTHTKLLANLCPKPVREVSKPLVLTTTQTAVSSSDSLGNQSSPMKWVVEENPQSASCLVPVKSSNGVASNILRTLVNSEDEKNNPASILPTCSKNLNETQVKIPSIKDNALVMFNGKVYLLTKKESSVTSASRCGKQAPPSAETQFRKNTSQLINSAADSTITSQVVNLVLSKNKGIVPYTKDPKSSVKVKLFPQSERKHFKINASSFTPLHGNRQISNTSKPETMSTLEDSPVGRKVDKKIVTKEMIKQGLQKIITPKVPATALQPSTRHGTNEEQNQKMERILAGVAAQIKQRKERHRKHCLELRKKFGLHREERVYLQRIPLSVILRKSKASVRSSSVQMSDSCKLPQAVSIKPGPEEEKEIIEEQEEELNIKRKAKKLPIQENTKKQKTEIDSIGKPNLECGNYDSGVDNPSSSCTQLVSEQENPTSIQQFSESADPNSNLCIQSNEDEISTSALPYSESETPLRNSFREDFSFNPPDLEETIRDEKIAKLKFMLREREAALEEIRKKMQQT